jgi:alkylation response protein AidB-like acyl-CoA dehydrogenase
MTDFTDALQDVIDDTVAAKAAEVDAGGYFPKDAVQALSQAGLLGLTVSESMGGRGLGLREAAQVIERLAGACGSTAMVVLMHYVATAAIEGHGREEVRRQIGTGEHLTTLAFSEVGSRSHFWAPSTTAVGDQSGVRLDGRKSWVTAAREAQSYVISSLPIQADGPMTLWLAPASARGLTPGGSFDGLGLRGNGSVPVDVAELSLPMEAMIGADGAGLDLALTEILPWFLVLSAAFCVGLMKSVTGEVGTWLQGTRLTHLNQSLAEQPLTRVDHARMRVATDSAAALVEAALSAIERQDPAATLLVLETKAAAGEAALQVTDLAMKVCGGAAFRKELPVERLFRDARAARVMAPTTDTLLDFIGRAINHLPML